MSLEPIFFIFLGLIGFFEIYMALKKKLKFICRFGDIRV